uniref:ShKT domain-containing protein n=1 Tax=Strongyloides stercoralis TaxID=6248 RepID=A0AAF5I1S0_STRER
MFTLYKIFLFFFILSPIIYIVPEKEGTEFCPQIYNEQIQNCVLPVSQFAKILHQQGGDQSSSIGGGDLNQAFSIPKVGKDVFHELCRLIRNFDSCVIKSREECPRHITINLIDASYGYLCNEAHDVFLNSAECLMELDLQPDIKQCHDETLHEIETISTTTDITLLLKLDRMCRALNYFSSCVRIPIKEKCGNEAWHVIYHVLKHTTKTLMPGCIFNYNHYTRKHHSKKVHTNEGINNHNQDINKQNIKLESYNDGEERFKNYNENDYDGSREVTNNSKKFDIKIENKTEKNEDEIDEELTTTVDYDNKLFESTTSKDNLILNCLDTNPHCKRLERACLLPTYRIKMQTECPLTCNLCLFHDNISKDNNNVNYNSSSFQLQPSYIFTIALFFWFMHK